MSSEQDACNGEKHKSALIPMPVSCLEKVKRVRAYQSQPVERHGLIQ